MHDMKVRNVSLFHVNTGCVVLQNISLFNGLLVSYRRAILGAFGNIGPPPWSVKSRVYCTPRSLKFVSLWTDGDRQYCSECRKLRIQEANIFAACV
jgi:hypothetical protein